MRSVFRWWTSLLVFSMASATEQSPIGGRCKSDGDCREGLDCSYGTCLNRECLAREFHDMTQQFDPQEYKEMLLKEAGITARDLFVARREHRNDVEFHHSSPVQAFLNVINGHSRELEEVALVLQTCAIEDPDVTGEVSVADARTSIQEDQGKGLGRMVGNFLGHIQQLIPGNGRRLLPDKPVNQRKLQDTPSPSLGCYLGFHLEAGVGVDGSISLFFPTQQRPDANGTAADGAEIYLRACIGTELGLGADLSLLVLWASNRYNDEIEGLSILIEFPGWIAVGPGIGLAHSHFATGGRGDLTYLDDMSFEAYLGMGLGIEVLGGAVCQTARIDY